MIALTLAWIGLDWAPVTRWTLTGTYLTVLLIASVYGLHRYWLAYLQHRLARHPLPEPDRFDELPHVTIQLPMYNESAVARRIIEATCAIDYPRDRLEIQVLDDSTDDSADVARACVEAMRQQGHRITWLHRKDRIGFKAGALQAGLEQASGRFIAVFDADFVPPRDFLKRTIHHFTDPQVGMVQAAWDHLNREHSLLTRCQAIYLDSHFQIEHTARHRSGRWINFNGTAGVWRREAIVSAGGWEHDTLTEDVDLSYRAQLAGWRFVYLPDLFCPAELPPHLGAFQTQQHRWIKGTVQTAIKLLPRIACAPMPLGHKIEAWFHLTSPIVYPCVVLIALLMLPAVLVNLTPFERGTLSGGLFGLMVLMLATASGCAYYVAGQRVRGFGLGETLRRLPMLIAVGVGMSLNNTRAVLEALVGHQSPFLRTPKGGSVDHSPGTIRQQLTRRIIPALETTMAVYLGWCIIHALKPGPQAWTLPFLILFASGFAYVAAWHVLPIRSLGVRPMQTAPLT